ncbi:acyl-CoA dehydrogenase family protein [Acuticoccus mangrovi]|uniref:Acyl-CoA dehydrogenase family protein n=1 Tax=Acuticoccus mangrovi TaxID=2796142 RepID=A0A934IS50_9HYPH|nr:acyl-CoA dehydrogenase family protein [Acuticoccus mangrovi]MBJ3777045.1 acyl-CoA dehydrogenase family protein [Acuticoccus mangrovi]
MDAVTTTHETETLAAYRARLADFLAASAPAHLYADSVAYRPASNAELADWERACWQAGFWGVTWPTAYGGHGLTMRHHLVANEEIGRLALPPSVNSIGKELVGPIILKAGSEAQKQEFLPRILSMDDIWCQGFSEPGAGSDLARLRTKAVKIDGGWRIDGQKTWTSYADRASHCLLLARTGTVEDRHKGLVLFAVPMTTPGIEARPIAQMTEAEGFCETFFSGVEVPDDALVGAEDGGWAAAVSVLSVERATNRMYRGMRFENELRHLIRTLKTAPSLAPRLEDGAVRVRLAALWRDMEVVKANARDVVERIMAGAEVGEYGSFIKLHWSEAHQRLGAFALELLSGARETDDPDVARARARFEAQYLEDRAATIYAGTSEIQLGIIADRILRLPRTSR